MIAARQCTCSPQYMPDLYCRAQITFLPWLVNTRQILSSLWCLIPLSWLLKLLNTMLHYTVQYFISYLISAQDCRLRFIVSFSVVGTSSLRRSAQLKRAFPHLIIEDVVSFWEEKWAACALLWLNWFTMKRSTLKWFPEQSELQRLCCGTDWLLSCFTIIGMACMLYIEVHLCIVPYNR